MFENIAEPKVTVIKKKRKKQKLETIFSYSFKQYPELLGHKLHNNPMAHQTTHCDFEVMNKHGNIYFIEAKEVQLNEKDYGCFPFNRLTQFNSLIYYDKFSNYTYSFILLFFRANTMKNSRCFFIPINRWKEFTLKIGKKSANLNDVSNKFSNYSLTYKDNRFDLSVLC